MKTGRSVSAAIASRIRTALETGEPFTYSALAARARCSSRTIRNYLDEAHAILGLRVRRERGNDRTILVRAEPGEATIEQLGHALAHEMLRRVFPIAGTALGRKKGHPGLQLVVSVRGAYQYGESHLRALRRWLQAASSKRRVRFGYGEDDRPRAAWPIGIVVRDLARVYLAGVPSEAADARDVRTYALERLRPRTPVIYAEGPEPPEGLGAAKVSDAIDDPFSMFPPAHNGAMVHVRFTPREAKYVAGRLWHRTQRIKRRQDGSIDLRFGPADLDEAAAWVRQWGRGVQVLGDERLREATR